MVSFGKQLKNLGLTTGLGMVARMANGATPREAIRTAGTSALVGSFVDDESIAASVTDAVDVLAKQRQVGKTLDGNVPVGYNTVGVAYTDDEFNGAKSDLANVLKALDFGEYDAMVDAIIEGLVEVKSVLRRLKAEEDGVNVPSAVDLM